MLLTLGGAGVCAPGAAAVAAEQPMPMALVAAGEEFQATGTLVPTTIAEQPDDGFALTTAAGQLRIVPSVVENRSPNGSLAATGAAVLFPSIDRHSDAVVRPRADGIEILTTLRARNAPSSPTWKLGMSGDERLVSTEAGGAQIVDPTPGSEAHEPATEALRAEDVATQAELAPRVAPGLPEFELEGIGAPGGEVVAEIAPAVSVDANGASVPTRLAAHGDELAVHVDSRGAAFPIVISSRVQVRPYRVVTVEDFDLVASNNCKRSFQRRVFESLLGTDLGWVRLKKHFCWDRARRRVTYASGVLEYDTTGAGSVAQWDVDTVTSRNENYFPWHGHPHGGHQSLAAVRFKQSALGWGFDSETVSTEIRGHADGSVSKP